METSKPTLNNNNNNTNGTNAITTTATPFMMRKYISFIQEAAIKLDLYPHTFVDVDFEHRLNEHCSRDYRILSLMYSHCIPDDSLQPSQYILWSSDPLS